MTMPSSRVVSRSSKGRTTRNAIGYIATFADDPVDPGPGSEIQHEAIAAECQRRRWPLSAMFEDTGGHRRDRSGQPSLRRALKSVRTQESPALVVATLESLSLPLADLAGLMEQAATEGWPLLILDPGVDTSSPAGEKIAGVISALAQLERRLMGHATNGALTSTSNGAARLGRPRVVDPAVRARIVGERAAGRSLRAIASDLTAEKVPTARGGAQWYASSVRQIAETA